MSRGARLKKFKNHCYRLKKMRDDFGVFLLTHPVNEATPFLDDSK